MFEESRINESVPWMIKLLWQYSKVPLATDNIREPMQCRWMRCFFRQSPSDSSKRRFRHIRDHLPHRWNRMRVFHGEEELLRTVNRKPADQRGLDRLWLRLLLIQLGLTLLSSFPWYEKSWCRAPREVVVRFRSLHRRRVHWELLMVHILYYWLLEFKPPPIPLFGMNICPP